MTNVRKKQIRTLGVLLVTVITLAVGFAAFSSSLNIKTRLSVNPNNGTFLVKFSKSSSTLDESDVVPTKSSDIFTAYNGEIDNDTGIPTISNLGGQFTQPGETITYDFYTLNTGSYNAYLTDIIFNNVEGTTTNKVCTSVDGTHQSEVDEACKGISIKVIMGIDTIIGTRTMTGHTLEPDESEPVRVIIGYSSTAVLPEVEFTVDFGTISMIYNSLEESDVASNNDDPSLCFISVRQGVVSDYICDNKNVTIPDSLPISEVKSISFNYDKCVSTITLAARALGDGNPRQSAINQCNSYSSSDIETIEEYATAILDGSFKNDESYENWMASLYKGAIDIEYEIVDNNLYPIDTIGDYSFAIKGINSVEFNNSITDIEIGAFIFNNLTSIELPSNLNIITKNSFMFNKLTSVEIPSSTERIDKNSFTSNLITTLDFSEATSLTEIGESAFSYNQITALDLSEATALETIGENAFSNNQLSTLNLIGATSLETIDTYAFFGNFLTSVEIPNSVQTIGIGAFNKNNITSVEIGSGIEHIDSYAFKDGSGTDYFSGVFYGPNEITSVRIHINKDTSILGTTVFGWVSGKTDDDICWNDVCPNN